MSYVTDQVEEFYDDRGLIPTIIVGSRYRYLHSAYQSGQRIGLMCRTNRQPKLTRRAQSNQLLWRQCPRCSRNYLVMVVRSRIYKEGL